MEILLFDNFVKDHNSTKHVNDSTGRKAEVYLKDRTSVINPTFLIDGIDLSVNYIKWNNRYYFVDNIILNNNNIYEITCSEDTLASWKSEILKTSQYVMRNSNTYDGNVIDNLYPVSGGITITEDTASILFMPSGIQYFTVAVTSGNVTAGSTQLNMGCVAYYIFSRAALSHLIDYLTNNLVTATQIDLADLSEGMQKALINPLQYIKSIVGLPYIPSLSGSGIAGIAYNSVIPIGAWNYNIGSNDIWALTTEAHVDKIGYTFTLNGHPQGDRGGYMNISPYTERILQFYPFGEFSLDTTKLYGAKNVYVEVDIDAHDGSAHLLVRRETALGNIIMDSKANVGIQVPITQITQNIMGAATSIGSGTMGLLSNMSHADVIGGAMNIANTVGNVMNSLKPQSNTVGSLPTFIDYRPEQTRLRSYFFSVVGEDVAHYGRPLCEVKTLSSLTGFTLCTNSHISFPCLTSETEIIKNHLNNGFYIE